MSDRYAQVREALTACGQAHVLAFWDELDPLRRNQLLNDLAQVDLGRVLPLIQSMVVQKPQPRVPSRIEPPPVYPRRPTPALEKQYTDAIAVGEKAMREGRVALLTVAGGQGTRLGYDGPKGAMPLTPIRNASLFQLFAESLTAIGRKFGRRPRWYVMTSPANHVQTAAFFEKHEFFGLAPEEIFFFQQGQMPSFTMDGKFAMADKHRLALAPDGHGGALRALATSGALAQMRKLGIEYISYFQVDNPLVRLLDALFIGLHITTGSEMSSKAVRKAHEAERVGAFCLADGKLTVIEYSDLPEEIAKARNPDGSLRFDAGSIAVHILSTEFVERITAPGSASQLPWHRAEKAVELIDAKGNRVKPTGPNVVKLETFVFDAIPLAKNPLVMYTPREDEFSPVKNADGADSPATARADMMRRAARWLEGCGVKVPRKANGDPDCIIEISPAFALTEGDLRNRLSGTLTIEPGNMVLLA